MMMKKLVFLCLLNLTAFVVHAEQKPASTLDNRMQTFDYTTEDVFLIKTKMGHSSLIQFEAGEIIHDDGGLGVGEARDWSIAAKGNNVFFKPLKEHIENQGGKVIGATVMTAYDKKMDIIIKPNMLQSLENKQGLKEYWLKEFGYDIDKLTQQEAGHLKKPTLEQISERVQEARHALEQQKETSNEQHSTNHETQQREVYQAPAFEPAKTGRTNSLQPARGRVLQSVLRQEESSSSNPRLSTQNTYINCPYAEKNQAKALGAKWDNANKSWYVPSGLDLSKFEKWLTPEAEKEVPKINLEEQDLSIIEQRQPKQNALDKAVDKVMQGYTPQYYVRIGRTPDVLRMLGLPDGKISIRGHTIEKILAYQIGVDNINISKHSNLHNLKPETLKQLSNQLYNPIAVFKSSDNSSNPKGYVILTELTEKDIDTGDNKQVIASIKVSYDGKNIDITSVYGRDTKQIERDLGGVLYWDSKKGQQFIDSFGYQLPPSLSNAYLFHNYKTEQDLSQYILSKNLGKSQNDKQNSSSNQNRELSSEQVSTQNTYINCPYAEKDQAKALGAKWDNTNKSWYVPQGADLSKFEKWLAPEKEKTTERPTVTPAQQDKTYLYTIPSDNEAIQKLKADGIVKFDLPNKVWYTLEPENPQVKQWLHPAYVPSAEEAFAEYLRANGISLDNGHPIFDEKTHRLSNDSSNDKNVMYQAYPNPNGIPFARVTNFSRGSEPENWQYPKEYLHILKNIEAVERAKGNQSYSHSQPVTIKTQQPIASKEPKELEQEKIAQQNLMAERAKMVMSFAPIAPKEQNYLAKKQVTANDIV